MAYIRFGRIQLTFGNNLQNAGGTFGAPVADNPAAAPAGRAAVNPASGTPDTFRRSPLLKGNYVLNRTAGWGMGGMVVAHTLEELGAESAGTPTGLAIIGGLFALTGLSAAIGHLQRVRHNNENDLPVKRMDMSESLKALASSTAAAALAAGVVWLFDGSDYAKMLAAGWVGTIQMATKLTGKLFSTANPEYKKAVYQDKRFGGLPKPKVPDDDDLRTIRHLIKRYGKQEFSTESNRHLRLIAAYDHREITQFLYNVVLNDECFSDERELAIKAIGMRHDAVAKDLLIRLISEGEWVSDRDLAEWIYQQNVTDGVYQP